MEHLTGCQFEKIVSAASKGTWVSGTGEISGYIDINYDCISFNDGWNYYQSLDFIYCPCCGVKLLK